MVRLQFTLVIFRASTRVSHLHLNMYRCLINWSVNTSGKYHSLIRHILVSLRHSAVQTGSSCVREINTRVVGAGDRSQTLSDDTTRLISVINSSDSYRITFTCIEKHRRKQPLAGENLANTRHFFQFYHWSDQNGFTLRPKQRSQQKVAVCPLPLESFLLRPYWKRWCFPCQAV